MHSVLETLVSGVRADTAERRLLTSDAHIHRRADQAPPARSCISALARREWVHVIAEIKRSSPSKGPLAPDLDPAALAVEYAAGGASVISVLTEQRRFGGSLADLDAVRAAVDTPLLRKDFIVEDFQVIEARAHGADLVLLIVAALDDAALRDLLSVTRGTGMAALVEVHDEREAERALNAGADIVGINNRDLTTLEVDRGTFARVARGIPEGVVLVAESGLTSTADVASAAAAGADAVLVGEALVTAGRPADSVAEFIRAGSVLGRRHGDAVVSR